MPLSSRRALKIVAVSLVTVVAVSYLYFASAYRSANVFAPPERITSLGRTYLISNFPPRSREELERRYSQGHGTSYTFERVSSFPVPLGLPVYQWQNDQIRGQATSSAYLEWSDSYISYQLSGAP